MRGEETERERGSFCRQRAALFRPIVGRCPGRAARGAGRGAVGTGGGPGDAPPPGCHRGGRAPRCPFPESPEQRGAVVSVSETRWTPLRLWAPAARRADCASRVRVPPPPRFGSPAAAFRARCHLPSRSDARPRRPRSCVPNSPVLTVSSLSVIPRPPRGPPLSAQGRGLISATPGEALSPPPRPLLGCAVVPAAEVGVSEQVSR